MITVPKPGKLSTDLFWNATSGQLKKSEGRCRMCQRPRRVRPLTRHHLVPLRWFMGDGYRYRTIRNSNANIVPLCRPCHDLIEDYDPIARKMLRRLLTQQEVAFAVRLRGIAWLNWEYPLDQRSGSYEHEREEAHCDYYKERAS